MELRLAVQPARQQERGLAIEALPEHLVGQLCAALTAYLDLTGRHELYSRRTRAWLGPAQTIAASGLRTGDRVLLADPSQPPLEAAPPARPPLVDLVAVGGPEAGRRIPLPAGEHRLGGSRYATVLLDDPALAPVHLVITVVPSVTVTIRDAGSETGTFLDGKPVTGQVEVRHGQLVTAGRSVLAFESRDPGPAVPPALDASGRVVFNRPPRVTRPAPATAFRLEAPPQRERGQRLALSSAIVPLAMGAGMFAFFRSVTYLLFMLLSPLMLAFSFLETRFGGGRRHRKAVAAFRRRLKEVDEQMAAATTAAAAHARATCPDVPTLLERARTLDPALWERSQDGADWLLLRVGWGDRPSGVTLDVAPGGEDALRGAAAEVGTRHGVLSAAPMAVSLREAGVLGISGDCRATGALARAAGVQLAALHSPEDLVLAAAVPAGDERDWEWLGWLPHVLQESGPVPGQLVVSDRPAARALVERLQALVKERREARGAYHGAPADRLGPSVVAFLHERAELPRGATAALLEQGPAVGVHAVWLGSDRRSLPAECGAVVDLPAGGPPTLTFPATGETLTAGGVDGASVEVAAELARALAPVRDVSARESQAGIPRRVDLLELLGMRGGGGPEARIMANWIRDRAAPGERLHTAVLGMAAGGRPFAVSLRGDGPHALVGGMTGSGKSELLQTLVAALAAAHGPRSLNFLLVDYKGGAAFKDCIDLPHTVGFVTDLDGHLVNRALVSLRAELRRREEILREAGAKDLLDLERRDPDRTPASLLIVVDEFAALAAELPEFVDGMVDVAQRGRSLGIHLLLATQRPQGVINDRIRANTNLRLSLRFSDESESQDVIGTRDAARPGLPPGRAFARTGPGEVVEFQAGYAGGRAAAASGPAPVIVRDLAFGGVVVPVRGNRAVAEPESETDLMRLVAAVGSVNRSFAFPPPPRPWLPTLPEVVSLEGLAASAGAGRRSVIGLLDDPAGQRQLTVGLDLESEGNLLVFGTSGSGKTSLLRTIAVSAALRLPPSELQVYALDFATRGLKPLEALPHCGGVVSADEPERVIRLLGMLRAEAERRRRALASSGAATLGEHLARGRGERLPFLLVLLDGYPAFVSALEDVDIGAHVDALRALVAEGRPLGIAFAISADRHAGSLSALSASVVRRVVLRLATDEEYALLGLPRSVYAGAHLPPGRGFTESGLEVHCAIVGSDPSGGGQAASVTAVGAALRKRFGGDCVPPVRLLPTRVPRESLPRAERPLAAVVGIEDVRLSPVSVDLEEGHFLIAGPRRSGRTTALEAFAASLAASPEPPELHLLAPRRQSRLPALDLWTSAATGIEECGALVDRLAAEARAANGGGERRRVLVVDDGDELADGGYVELDWIAQRGAERGLRIVVGLERTAAQRAYSGWLFHVLRERQGLLLDPDPAVDGTIVGGVQLPRRRSAWPAGRAYLVRRGVVELVQVASD